MYNLYNLFIGGITSDVTCDFISLRGTRQVMGWSGRHGALFAVDPA